MATYGEDPERAKAQRMLWDGYHYDAVADGAGSLICLGWTARSVLAHVWWRMRHGAPTAIPAGILLVITGFSAASFAFVPGDPFPARAHLHIGGGLLVSGIVFLRFPRSVPRRGMAIVGFSMASAMLHGMSVVVFERFSDYVIFAGSIVVALAGIALLWWALSAGPESLQRRGLEGFAVGAACFGLGNLDWYQATDTPAHAMSCLASAASTLLLANAIMRVRELA